MKEFNHFDYGRKGKEIGLMDEQSKLQQIPADISSEELADWLKWAIEYVVNKPERYSSLSAEDIEVIRRYAEDENPLVRSKAIGYMVNNRPCTWDELELWGLDPDEEVRNTVVWAIELNSDVIPAAVLSRTDKPRCVKLLELIVQTYGDGVAAEVLNMLSKESIEWFDLTWAAAERLLASEDVNVTSPIIISYFEDIIPEKNWGPEDPHIRSWIEGDDIHKKCALLTIASYLKLKGGKLREIVEALTHDPDNDIAAGARLILSKDKQL